MLHTKRKCFITTLVRKAGGAPDVRSGRKTPLVMGSIITCSAAEEAVQVAQCVTVNDCFAKDLFVGGTETDDLLTIATPAFGDWDQVITYEGFSASDTQEKSLYVKFPHVDGWLQHDLTQALVALIELAEVIMECDRLYVCLEREMRGVGNLVHSLMYAGFSVINEDLKANPKYLILEYETE